VAPARRGCFWKRGKPRIRCGPVTPDHDDARVQRATLLLLHHLQPTLVTRAELLRQLVDSSTSNDAAQRAIDDLAALGVIRINASDETVRLPLPVFTVLQLVER
jgi:hypothetical protein